MKTSRESLGITVAAGVAVGLVAVMGPSAEAAPADTVPAVRTASASHSAKNMLVDSSRRAIRHFAYDLYAQDAHGDLKGEYVGSDHYLLRTASRQGVQLQVDYDRAEHTVEVTESSVPGGLARRGRHVGFYARVALQPTANSIDTDFLTGAAPTAADVYNILSGDVQLYSLDVATGATHKTVVLGNDQETLYGEASNGSAADLSDAAPKAIAQTAAAVVRADHALTTDYVAYP